MPNKPHFFRLKCWLYRLFVIVPEHRKIKRRTRLYWEELEAAKKAGITKDIIIASIRLNQALLKYHQRRKDPLSSYKSVASPT